MNKGTIICGIIVLLGIVYFDDIKNIFTGDKDKASLIIQQHMNQQQQSTTNGSGGGIYNPTTFIPDDPEPDPEPTTPPPMPRVRQKTCNSCVGRGYCGKCAGTGMLSGYSLSSKITCTYCNGTRICSSCRGTGLQ